MDANFRWIARGRRFSGPAAQWTIQPFVVRRLFAESNDGVLGAPTKAHASFAELRNFRGQDFNAWTLEGPV